MRKWIVEDWEFEVTVLSGEAQNCRLRLEKDDRFVFQYECPAGFCPRAMIEVYTWCEVIRCGGDFTYRGVTKNMKWSYHVHAILLNFILPQFP